MRIHLNPLSVDDYRTFLRVKALPKYRMTGRTAHIPDEYAHEFGGSANTETNDYTPNPRMFDYQRDIVRSALNKKRYSVFADCGLGKTLIMLDFAMEAHRRTGKRVLIVAPLMTVRQTSNECDRFYGEPLRILRSNQLADWLACGDGVAITNYESITDEVDGQLGGLILDESSMLKSQYGAWGTRLLLLGRGVEYKMCLTGTPAPNDRIEYANHAVFMDAFPTVNSFLATFFVNRGQTNNRWELKPHAIGAFYKALSHWCIFLTDPSTYGWKDGARDLPPIHIHTHDVPLTDEQRESFMDSENALFCSEVGGIGSRSRIARIAKGIGPDGEPIPTNKTSYIVDLVNSWPGESTIIWCRYNAEQDIIASAFPGCANITGSTPIEERERLIDAFKSGETRVLVTKPKILGFGLNLQIATRQVFSTLQDSYEEFYQAVKRSNRYGSTKPLSVHIPITELEAPMVSNVIDKSHRVEADALEQERIYHEHSWNQ